jgi:CubicO group peptidase (beta-lactamase class C family)
MISTLIGIEEGKIKSTDNPITNYLPEFKTKPGFEKITIKNLLQHTSGIKFSDQNLILFQIINFIGVIRKEMTALTIKTAPNMEFHYSSAIPIISINY